MNIFCFEGIGRMEKVFALFGHPVAHSVSPLMQNRAFEELGLNCCYLAFDVKAEDLEVAVKAIRALGLGGANITIPHKERVIQYLDEVEEQANLIGAVNTVANCEGVLVGYNTDAPGFLQSLRYDAGFEPGGKQAVILGAGGAARAVAFALVSAGVKRLAIFNRNPFRAEALANDISVLVGYQVEAGALQSSALMRELAETDLLVNATSAGMHPDVGSLPLQDLSALRPGMLVYDLVYNPPKTRLLQEAEKRGCGVCSGIGMLVYQGALAFEIWTRKKAPVAVMRQVVEKALKCLRN